MASHSSLTAFTISDSLRIFFFIRSSLDKVSNFCLIGNCPTYREGYSNAFYSVVYITDHLGSVRVEVGPDGTVLKNHEFLPYGEHLGGNVSNVETNDYLYGGKELQQRFGVNLYDSGARFQSNTGAFTSPDPLAEKYYSISPYAYCAGNPVKFLDFNGEAIHVAEDNQELFFTILRQVFGNYSDNFHFNDSGILAYDGTTKGMNKEQKETFKGIKKIMDDETITNVSFNDKIDIKTGAVVALASENEGMDDNNIVINPNTKLIIVYEVTDAYYIVPIDPKNGARFKERTIETNPADMLFHEFGHVIYDGESQDKVLKYNNYVRKTLGLTPRKQDETHNKTVK